MNAGLVWTSINHHVLRREGSLTPLDLSDPESADIRAVEFLEVRRTSRADEGIVSSLGSYSFPSIILRDKICRV